MSNSNERREKGKAFARRILKDGPPPFSVPKKFQRYTLENVFGDLWQDEDCLLYTSPSPRDRTRSRMPSSA